MEKRTQNKHTKLHEREEETERQTEKDRESEREREREIKLDTERWDKSFQTIFENFVAQSR